MMNEKRTPAPSQPGSRRAWHIVAGWLSGDSARSRVARALAVAALLAVHYGLMISSVATKSTTSDEIVHLSGGYSYWKLDDYRINPENGNFPGRWAALPLLAEHVRFPDAGEESWRKSDEWLLGDQFFHRLGNDLPVMLLSGRMMIGLLSVGLGLIVYLWSGRLFGPIGGMVSLVLYAFEPTVLANGCLVTSDMAAAFFFALSLYAFWLLLERITWPRLALSCVALGLLFVSKMSAPLGVFMLLVLLGVRLCRRQGLDFRLVGSRELAKGWQKLLAAGGLVAAHALVVFVIIWGFLGFRYSPFADSDPGHQLQFAWCTILENPGPVRDAIAWSKDHQVLPEAYLFGFGHAYKYSGQRRAFLNGQYSLQGWWYFFPYTFAVKTPVSAFVMLLLAMAAGVQKAIAIPDRAARRRWLREGLYAISPILVMLAVYWAMAIHSSLNIGHRHLLPTYPMLYILAGMAGYWFKAARKLLAVIAGLALLGLVVDMGLAWPNYLAYFNALAGGPARGYQHLVDSSLDWGQDLPGLKNWLDRRHLPDPQRPVYLAYFGTGSPEYYGIVSQSITPTSAFGDARPRVLLPEMRAGVYCLSASTLLGASSASYAGGPWTTDHEGIYQALKSRFGNLVGQGLMSTQALHDATPVQHQIEMYDALRNCRLFAYCRHRQPDDNVNFSILVFTLSDTDIQQALEGPPAELYPGVGG